jgi:hypothetical protein
MESLNTELAQKTVKRYACSNCWGDLEITPDMTQQDMYFVICQKCKDETKGYVTKFYVNRRRNESEFEKRDVTRLLQKIGILAKPDYGPPEKILHDLGF